MDLSRVCSSCSRGTDEDIIFDLDHYSVVGGGGFKFLYLYFVFISFSLYLSCR